MDIRATCRVCLANNIKMHSALSIELQEIYEKLTGTKWHTEDGRPTSLCYICYAHLRRTAMFTDTARQAETVLRQLCSAGLVYTADILSMMDRPVPNYTKTPIEHINLYDGQTDIVIKTEEADDDKAINKEDIKETNPEDIKLNEKFDPTEDAISYHYGTESEDDLPLTVLKTERQNNVESTDEVEVKVRHKKVKDKVKQKRLKVKQNHDTEKRPYTKQMKINATLIKVPKQEQIEAVKVRAQSLNYIASPYKCTLCYRGFINLRSYNNHQNKHREAGAEFECDVCKLRYQSARLLRTHISTSHATLYRCNVCAHTSHTKHQARDHDLWHAGHRYPCQLCGDSFVKRTSYLSHVRARHASSAACDACGDTFVGAHGLRMHQTKAHRYQLPETGSEDPSEAPRVTKHTQDIRLPCEQCGETFPRRSQLNAHVRRKHLGIRYNKNIVCEVCGKTCKSNAALKYHQRVHSGERAHPCAACGKTFADRNQLRIHTRTHTGERPYCCQHCHKRFSQKPALNTHYRVHTGAKPYKCELCAKCFSQSNSLKAHVRSVHLKLASSRKKPPRPAQTPTDPQQTTAELAT